jgi:hypothetical protein
LQVGLIHADVAKDAGNLRDGFVTETRGLRAAVQTLEEEWRRRLPLLVTDRTPRITGERERLAWGAA